MPTTLYTSGTFNAGSSNWADPALLPAGMMRSIIDATVETGVLHPVTAPTESGSLPDVLNYVTEDRNVVRYNRQYYWSENSTATLGSSLGYMGVVTPSGPPDIRYGARGERFTGQYRYTYTYVTRDGYESAPFFPSSPDETRWASINCSAASVSMSLSDFVLFSTARYYPGTTKKYGYSVGERVQFGASVWECTQSFSAKTTTPLAEKYWPGSSVGAGAYWKDVTSAVTAQTGYESIVVSFAAPTDTSVQYTRIYRTAKDDSEFHLLAEVESALAEYTDTISDSELLLNEPLATLDSLPPIYTFSEGAWTQSGGRYLTEVNGVFWLAVDDRVYYSEQGSPHAWNASFYVRTEGDVTALARSGEGLLVFTSVRTYLVTGSTFDTLVVRDLATHHGCANWRTVSHIRDMPLWMSADGLCGYAGAGDLQVASVKNITEHRWRFPSTPKFSGAFEDTYFAFMDDGVAIAVDFRTGEPVITQRTLPGEACWYDRDTNTLYILDSDRWKRMSGGEKLLWTLISGDMQGDPSKVEYRRLKRFRRVWVDSDGDVDIKPYADDVEAASVTSTGVGRRWTYLPNMVGMKLRLELSGASRMRGFDVEAQVY